jgi:hypothetical protein
MPTEENTDRQVNELGPARRRRTLRTERTNSQALLIAAIPLAVLLVIVVLGAWIMNSEGHKGQLASIPSPTHLPTLRSATLVAINKTATPTTAVTAEVVATATTEPKATATTAAVEPTATAAEPEATATPESGGGLAVGATAQVSGTAGSGLRIRAEAGLSGPTVKVVPEGSLVTILAGPEAVDDYQWYQIRDDAGTEGWVAGDWLVPTS